LRVRGGARFSTRGFLLEGRGREGAGGLKIGFTVTKKLGCAVVRNRIRRRLKAAIQATGSCHREAAVDCVVLARPPALDLDFKELSRDMAAALDSVIRNATSKRSRTPGPRP
jgi:ribonuclease P protein component